MSSLCHLHLHSTKSRLDGWGTEAQIVDRAVELGHKAVAVTDHGNVCAHVPLWEAAKKKGIKPIFGCEFYIVEDMEERTATQESLGVNAFPHVTVLALDQQGYRNLLRLSRMSWQEGFFKYPRIDWEALARCSDGLAVLTGCVGGWPSRLLHNKGEEEAFNFLHKWMYRIDRLYVELNPVPGYEVSTSTCFKLLLMAKELGLPTVVTADAHFPCPADYRCQDMLLAIGTGRMVDDPTRQLKLPSDLYICSDREMAERLIRTDARFRTEATEVRKAFANTVMLAEEAAVELPRAEPLRFAGLREGESSYARLWAEVDKGIKNRVSQGLIEKEEASAYLGRCRTEFDTLHRKGFCDYILIVADIIREIKSRGAVVLTRGSAGGCCLLWAVGASETDPIKHGLSFERFFDDNRSDPPDVDVDFPPAYREQAIKYVAETYGEANTARLGSFNTFQAKAAVKAVAKTLGIPLEVIHPVSSALSGLDDDVLAQFDQMTDPKAVAVLKRYPELKLADKFVGQMSNHGMHACGVVVSPTPLDEVIGLMRGKDGCIVSSIDKRGAKALGHLKMDLLSVKALDVMARCLELLGKKPEWLETISLDDPATLQTASEMKLAGVFQLDGAAAWRVSRIIGLDAFDDLAIASSICRPGPAEWASIYARNKRDPEEFAAYLSKLHPIAADIVRPTYGILVYQEQVMLLARQLANLEWPEVQSLRKGVSDKLGTQPDKEKADAWRKEWHDKFVNGCLEAGFKQKVEPQEAEMWWHSIESHGGYSFNKSHAVTYALLSYWMLYFKTHHWHQFYPAYLEFEDDPATRKRLLREFMSLGGQVQVINPMLSGIHTSSPMPGLIVGGYADLYKVGEVMAQRIVQKGPFQYWSDLLDKGCSKSVRERLQLSGLPRYDPQPQALCALAPWMPVQAMPPKVVAAREKRGWPTCYQIASSEMMEDEVMVIGFITGRSVNVKHVDLIIEDETGALNVRISARNLKKLGPEFRALKLADLVAISGWWSGDALYARGKKVIELTK